VTLRGKSGGTHDAPPLHRKELEHVDRGLAVVLTLITGAALSLAEACSDEDDRPPATDNLGNSPISGVAGGSGNAGGGSGSGASGGSSNAGGNGGGDKGIEGGINGAADSGVGTGVPPDGG
jgi:hypothetical protein